MLRFNSDKTQCVNFSRSCTNGSCSFLFFFKSIFCAKSLVHLGHVLTCKLKDNADIRGCSSDFCSPILYKLGCSLTTACSCMAVLCGPLIVVKLNT